MLRDPARRHPCVRPSVQNVHGGIRVRERGFAAVAAGKTLATAIALVNVPTAAAGLSAVGSIDFGDLESELFALGR